MLKVNLGDVLDVKRGASLSGEFYSEEGEKIRLTLGNFNYPGGGFKENTSKKDIYFNGPIKPEFILKKGDIITPLTEQVSGLLGETARIPEDDLYIQSGDVGLVIPNEKVLDKDFAYYLVSSPLVKKQLDAAAQQTKIRHTSPDAIKACEAYIPDLPAQKKIATLLDAINEKIANNNAICADLEGMAKLLYDYWFVQFDFPDENGKPYKSNGGKMVWNEELKREIPEGWSTIKIGEILAKVPSSEKIPTDNYLTTGYWPIIDQSINYIAGYTNNEKAIVKNEKGCVVFGDHTGYVKHILFDFARGADGTQVIYSHMKNFPSQLLFHLIKNVPLPNVGYSRHFMFLKESTVICPSEEIAQNYANITNPIYKKIKETVFENHGLASLRDFLLPMLMNGQVKVKDAG